MNILVIATHHGAFLTIGQLKQWNIKNVTVLIPQSQIDKYKSFEGKIFTDYEANLKKFCGKNIKLYVSENFNLKNKFLATHDFLSTIESKEKWLVLESGSLLCRKDFDVPECSTFGVVKTRPHEHYKKLYKMLGEPEVSESIYANCFFVNMEDTSGRISFIDSNTFHRPDVLFAKSFGTLWCLRNHKKLNKAIAMNFWMEAIRSKQEIGEWVAYPYDWYLSATEKCGFSKLPDSTVRNIVSNGEKSDWLVDLVALDL
jgi:hypothetical protein